MTNNDILTKIKPILDGLLSSPITNDDVSDKIIDFDSWAQPVFKKFDAGIKALNLKHGPGDKFGFNKSSQKLASFLNPIFDYDYTHMCFKAFKARLSQI